MRNSLHAWSRKNDVYPTSYRGMRLRMIGWRHVHPHYIFNGGITMKKIFLALLLVVVLCISGCEGMLPFSSPLDPPTWIQGTWEMVVGDTLISSLVFSSDNVVWNSASIGFNFKQLAQQSGINITDRNVTSTSYQMTMSGSGTTETFTFVLVSSDTLNMSLNTGGVIIDLDGFVKQ